MLNLLLGGLFLIAVSMYAALILSVDKTGKENIGKENTGKGNTKVSEKKMIPKAKSSEFESYFEAKEYELLTNSLNTLSQLAPERQRKLLEFCSKDEVLKFLIELLQSKDYKVRVAAVEKLGLLASKKTSLDLLEAVADKNEGVRLAATQALKRINNPDILPKLVEALENNDKWLPARIAELIIYFGTEAIPYLDEAMNLKDPVIRAYVVEILSEIGGEPVVYLLERALDDDEAEVRLKAVRSIGNNVHEKSREMLVKMLGDSDIRVQIQAIRSLPKSRRRNIVDTIGEKMYSEEARVRNAAFDVLKHLGDDGLGKIKEVAFSSDHPMGEATKQYLEELNK